MACDDSIPACVPSGAAPVARFVVRLRSKYAALIDAATRRFEIEMGLAERPAPLELVPPVDGAERERWIALAPTAEADRLPGLQAHARRVAALLSGDPPAARIEIEFVALYAGKAVLAKDADGPGRMYLGQGVWGECAPLQDSDGVGNPSLVGAKASGHRPEITEFLRSIGGP